MYTEFFPLRITQMKLLVKRPLEKKTNNNKTSHENKK